MTKKLLALCNCILLLVLQIFGLTQSTLTLSSPRISLVNLGYPRLSLVNSGYIIWLRLQKIIGLEQIIFGLLLYASHYIFALATGANQG